jgi:hypothetical protein
MSDATSALETDRADFFIVNPPGRLPMERFLNHGSILSISYNEELT